MKLAVILEDTISAGGGFNQALNAILQLKRLSEEQFRFVVLTSSCENVPLLKELEIEAEIFSPHFLDKVIGALSSNELTRRWLRRYKWLSPFESMLLRRGCDLVYFVAPTARVTALQKLNYILTIWDNCHRDFPEFPEVRSHGDFQRREFIFRNINQAFLILVDSEELANRLHRRYGVDRERLLAMPFSPNPFLKENLASSSDEVMHRYGLKQGFFLYPAQFWPHKNHMRIIQALTLLKERGKYPTVVFVGGDKGNRASIVSAVRREGLEAQVFNLGFVSNIALQALYERCGAVLMPTYFGPTNIPPIEAWQARRPLIYSQHLADQCQDAALLIDPDDPESLAKAMLDCEQTSVTEVLVQRGDARLVALAKDRQVAEGEFAKRLLQFSRRLSTWL